MAKHTMAKRNMANKNTAKQKRDVLKKLTDTRRRLIATKLQTSIDSTCHELSIDV